MFFILCAKTMKCALTRPIHYLVLVRHTCISPACQMMIIYKETFLLFQLAVFVLVFFLCFMLFIIIVFIFTFIAEVLTVAVSTVQHRTISLATVSPPWSNITKLKFTYTSLTQTFNDYNLHRENSMCDIFSSTSTYFSSVATAFAGMSACILSLVYVQVDVEQHAKAIMNVKAHTDKAFQQNISVTRYEINIKLFCC